MYLMSIDNSMLMKTRDVALVHVQDRTVPSTAQYQLLQLLITLS